MLVKTLKTFFVIFLGFFVFSGCAALDVSDTALDVSDTKDMQTPQHSIAEEIQTPQHFISHTKDGLTVMVGLFQNKEQLKKHFGMDLSKKDVLAVYIKIVNASDSSYLILKDTASFIVKAHHRQYQKIRQSNAPTDKKGNIAGDYEAALILTGPLFTAFKDVKGSKGWAVRHNILAKRLKSAMLSPGDERSGLLYFKVARAEDTPKKLTLNFHSLTTKRTSEFVFANIK